jgi:hypothetical protein
MKPTWTGQTPLPGSDFADREAAKRELFQRYPQVAPQRAAGESSAATAYWAPRCLATAAGRVLRCGTDRARARLPHGKGMGAQGREMCCGGGPNAGLRMRPPSSAARGNGGSVDETARRARCRGGSTLLTDIDDTLTSEGKLTAEAYSALEAPAPGGIARRPGHRAAGRLVRSHRAHVAGGTRGRGERRLLLLLRERSPRATLPAG